MSARQKRLVRPRVRFAHRTVRGSATYLTAYDCLCNGLVLIKYWAICAVSGGFVQVDMEYNEEPR